MTDNGYQRLFNELRKRVQRLYPDPLQLIRRKDFAELTKLPLGTVDYLVSTGQIPYLRLGKRDVGFHPLMIIDWYAKRLNVEYRKAQGKGNLTDG